MSARALRAAVLVSGLVAGSAVQLSAQSASEIVDAMLAAYEARIADVQNYTLVQAVMGFEAVTYYEKELSDGRPVFRTSMAGVSGQEGSPATGIDDVYALGDDLSQRSEYRGRESVNDYDVHVLEVTALRDTGFGTNVAQDSEFEPTRGRVYLDVDTYVPRRFTFEGEMTREGSMIPLTATMDMGDYRDVEGLLVPYRTITTIEGLGAAIDPEMRAQFEQMQRELEAMPPEQRMMIEVMMADQMRQFEAMMSDDAAPMVIEVLVMEVRVNQGPPR
jgi:hypothetical protein